MVESRRYPAMIPAQPWTSAGVARTTLSLTTSWRFCRSGGAQASPKAPSWTALQEMSVKLERSTWLWLAPGVVGSTWCAPEQGMSSRG